MLKTTRQEFLAMMDRYGSKAEVARQLGISQQSVTSRLARIRANPTNHGKPGSECFTLLTNEKLEEEWSVAIENLDLVRADKLFGEMCNRLEKDRTLKLPSRAAGL